MKLYITDKHFLFDLQLSDDQASKVMSWLPRKLAPHVRCIFSSVIDSHQYKTAMSRESKPIEMHLHPLDEQYRSVGFHCISINKDTF